MVETDDYRARGREEPFANLFLSCAGYRYIGVPEEQLPADQRFRAGMQESHERLNDPPGKDWDPQYDAEAHIHAMVLLAASQPVVLKRALGHVERSLDGIAEFRKQNGRALKHRAAGKEVKDQYVEHLNYVDGISQPLFLRADLAKAKRNGIDQYDPSAPLGLVLVKDPNGGPTG